MERRDFIKSLILTSLIFFNRKNGFSYGNQFYDETELIEKKLREYKKIDEGLSLSELISYVGKDFLGTPYEAGTLDIYTDREELVLKISGFDCVTFVENVLNFSRLINLGKLDLESFKNELIKIRYRDGIISDYTSRLHYFCDWIYENEKKSIIKAVTGEIGGVEYKKEINFMTSHKDSYKQLKENKSLVKKMYEIEDNINLRKIYYLKKSDIKKNQSGINTGDIIALTTEIEGLDVTHTGFAYIENGKLLFMHASQKYGKVIISYEGLSGYLNSIKKCSGIMIARPL
jgi:hypothetical protein